MKSIPLDKVKDKTGGDFDYLSVLRVIVTKPTTQGLGIGEVRSCVRILDALDAAEKSGARHLELEDSDHKALVGFVQQFKWAAAHRAIVQFVDDVTGAASKETAQAKTVKKKTKKNSSAEG